MFSSKNKILVSFVALSFSFFSSQVYGMDLQEAYDKGIKYYKGQGVVKNYKTAFRFFKLAADHEHPGAQSFLGKLYDNGEGVIKNPELAIKYYKLAADQEDITALFKLGEMYEYGQGVPQDHNLAFTYYAKAGLQGDEDAQLRHDLLGTSLGDAVAQYNLAYRYEYAYGVQQNFAFALQLYKLAADQGDLQALDDFVRLSKALIWGN